jgi:hypothetical protein
MLGKWPIHGHVPRSTSSRVTYWNRTDSQNRAISFVSNYLVIGYPMQNEGDHRSLNGIRDSTTPFEASEINYTIVTSIKRRQVKGWKAKVPSTSKAVM